MSYFEPAGFPGNTRHVIKYFPKIVFSGYRIISVSQLYKMIFVPHGTLLLILPITKEYIIHLCIYVTIYYLQLNTYMTTFLVLCRFLFGRSTERSFFLRFLCFSIPTIDVEMSSSLALPIAICLGLRVFFYINLYQLFNLFFRSSDALQILYVKNF